MKRMWMVLLTLILLLTILSGCWDRRELEERLSVIGLGIDRVEQAESGQPEYLLTVQIPIPLRIAGAGGGSGGEGGADSVKIISSTGFTVADALSELQKSLNQQLSLGHVRVIAISKELAKEGVKDIIDGFRRDPSIRRLLWLLVVEGKAEDLLYTNPQLETIPISYINSLIQTGAKMGEIPDITLGKFFNALSNTSLQPTLNYVRSSKEDVSWIGLALFDEDKMVGTLNSHESWTLMHLRREKPGGRQLIPFNEENNKYMMIHPQNADVSSRIKFEKGKVYVHYHVDVEANITEKNFDLDISKTANLQKLAKIVEKELETKAENLVSKLQQEYKVDALELGSKIRALHFDEWTKLDWKDAFPQADITVTYNVEFRRVGMELK